MEERRMECVAHKEKTEELRKTVFGNGTAGLKYELIAVKIKTNIILGLQTVILGTLIKIVFFGGK